MSARVTITVPDDVAEILGRAKVLGPFGTTYGLVLPPGQLPRQLYERVNKVLEAAGGKWSRKTKSHQFDRDPKEVLLPGVAGGEVVHIKNATQAFYTPPPLAKRMVKMIAAWGDRALEPSAGRGAIAAHLRSYGAHVTCVERDGQSADHLRQHGFEVFQTDFLTLKPAAFKPFDAVVMNPPFSKGQDVKHVLHAWEFLRPGGLMAAIVGPGYGTKKGQIYQHLARLVRDHHLLIEDLPAGTFAESGTDVRTVLITLRKP